VYWVLCRRSCSSWTTASTTGASRSQFAASSSCPSSSSPRPPAVHRVRRRVLQLSLELLVCSVHPPPGAFYFHWRPVYEHPPQDHPDLDLDFLDPGLNPDTDIDFVFYLDLDLNLEPDPDPDLDLEDDDEDHPPGASRLVPIDALLALPMFFRLYLVCR